MEAHRERRLAGDRGDALVDVVAGPGRREGEDRQAEIGQADIAHAAAEAEADAGEVRILQLGVDDRQPLVDRLRLVAELLEDGEHRALVEDEIRLPLGRRARHAEACLLAPLRLAAELRDQQLDHLQVLGFGRIEQAALHRPARVAVEELGELVGAVAVGIDVVALDLEENALGGQHPLGHLDVRKLDEGIELRRELDLVSGQRRQNDSAGAEIQSFNQMLSWGGGGHRQSPLLSIGVAGGCGEVE